VFAKIEAKDYETLRAKDQLNLERAKNNCFQGFEEGPLTFAPTYKYQPGTDVYETRAEKKLRAPAWCDRVLWRTAARDSVKLQNYRRAALNPSDHKPVSAAFACRMRKVVESKERVVYQELINTLNAGGQQSLSSIPSVDVNGLTVNIDKVYYEVRFFNVIYCFFFYY
jgi:phosphatidylinositol-bisphosphatase